MYTALQTLYGVLALTQQGLVGNMGIHYMRFYRDSIPFFPTKKKQVNPKPQNPKGPMLFWKTVCLVLRKKPVMQSRVQVVVQPS